MVKRVAFPFNDLGQTVRERNGASTGWMGRFEDGEVPNVVQIQLFYGMV